MKKIAIALTLALPIFAACGEGEKQQPTDSAAGLSEKPGHEEPERVAANEGKADMTLQFDALAETIIEGYWRLRPTSALYTGYYAFDDQLVVPDEASRQAALAFYREALSQLSTIDESALQGAAAIDRRVMVQRFERLIWELEDLQRFTWDPTVYNVGRGFGRILATPYKSLDDRLRTISRRLETVPAYYLAAEANLTSPTLEHTDLAIKQNEGSLATFTKAIPEAAEGSALSNAEKAELMTRLESAADAIEGYVAWLRSVRPSLEGGQGRSFRLGRDLYEAKFAHEIVSGHTARELYGEALIEKDRLHKEMIAISEKLWPMYFGQEPFPIEPLEGVRRMIDRLSQHHVAREDFIDEIRRHLPEITAFIVEKDLVDIDPSKPLVVREMPPYQRGTAGASINAPGPYDASANTYYNVTPLDAMSDEAAESYLREYNDWVLQILSIHEALPGHYTQLVHSNKSRSLVKSIFRNGAMIEGWAVYGERVMMEAGYGNNEPEMWLMYDKWLLRSVMNTIIDYSIQAEDMPREDVMRLLVDEAFQQQAEADQKWVRASVSQVQLTSYYAGYAQIMALREEMKAKQGDAFNLKDFHNTFLSYGSIPVPMIRELMLADLEKE